MADDIRWKQRLENYSSAMLQLREAVLTAESRALSDLEKNGLIQMFEFSHELAWNLMKDFFKYQGKADLMGSRDSTREAFSRGLVTDGEGWMQMIQSRNLTSHTYNKKIAEDVVNQIKGRYFELLDGFEKKMRELAHAAN